jgi:dolichol-phosphate mannosyltransferase
VSGASAAGADGRPADVPLTVVVPVRNEGANLRAWWDGASRHLPAGTRVLLVHDTPEDDTVPVARTLAAEGAPIELLRSREPGFPGAMLTGMLAAERGPVLVTMADLSDDLASLGPMLDEYRRGADVVIGSRFRPGGGLVGAPRVKALLARWGSAFLASAAGFPARDASNAFRLYDAALVHRLSIPAAAGFEVVLAVLVVAWEAGARIVEVPTTWRGRVEGHSHFRARWIPRYALLWGRALRHGVWRRFRSTGRRAERR